VGRGKSFEGLDYVLKLLEDLLRRMLVTIGGEPDQITEEDANGLKPAGLDAVGGLQLVSNVWRKNDAQEVFRALFLLLDLAQVRDFAVAQALLFEGGANAGTEEDGVERFGNIIFGA
jgi:hypothetical protein